MSCCDRESPKDILGFSYNIIPEDEERSESLSLLEENARVLADITISSVTTVQKDLYMLMEYELINLINKAVTILMT